MKVKLFTVNILDCSAMESELNSFLSAHRILSVQKELVKINESAYWTFIIEYQDKKSSVENKNVSTKKVDYKEILTVEQFIKYCKLRDLRKEIAIKESVPVYTIFTNEQLAGIVQKNIKSKSDLQKINGVGEAKIKKCEEYYTSGVWDSEKLLSHVQPLLAFTEQAATKSFRRNIFNKKIEA